MEYIGLICIIAIVIVAIGKSKGGAIIFLLLGLLFFFTLQRSCENQQKEEEARKQHIDEVTNSIKRRKEQIQKDREHDKWVREQIERMNSYNEDTEL